MEIHANAACTQHANNSFRMGRRMRRIMLQTLGAGGGSKGHPNCPNVHEKPNRQTDRQLRSVEAGLGAAAPGPAGVPGVGW